MWKHTGGSNRALTVFVLSVLSFMHLPPSQILSDETWSKCCRFPLRRNKVESGELEEWKAESSESGEKERLNPSVEQYFLFTTSVSAGIITRERDVKRCVKCDLISDSRDFNRCRLSLKWITVEEHAELDCLSQWGKCASPLFILL